MGLTKASIIATAGMMSGLFAASFGGLTKPKKARGATSTVLGVAGATVGALVTKAMLDVFTPADNKK